MSYCVNIISEEQLDPKEILRKIAGKGEKIMAINVDFPSLKFGRMYESLRGLEINKEDDGYEIRICTCSSWADYQLFAVVVDVMKELTNGIAYTEKDDPIDDPYKKFNKKWAKAEMEANWGAIRALVLHSGSAVVMPGMFTHFCVGPEMLTCRGMKLYSPYKENEEGFDWLTKYFTLMQWALAEKISTESRLAMQDADGNEMGISAIYIKNNQVSKFDYVSYAPLMAFINLDTEESVIIRFENFKKAVQSTDYDDTHFAGFDEYQMRTCEGDVEIDEIKAVMENAKKYVPIDVAYRPTFPGSGHDKKQNTFVLMWNPDNSDISLEEYIRSMQDFYTGQFCRSVHDWKKAKMDDRFYVIRVGDGKIGVVMAGIFNSQPYVSPNWSGKGRKQYVMELKPTTMINPEIAPMLTTEELENAIPDFMWRGGYSGRLLTEEQAMSLDSLFSVYLKKIETKDDGVNICVIKRM